ncbi:MAG: chalcone isomerase family protein [Betaproteobacteria bacterium]
MRRWLFLIFALCWAATAGALEIGGAEVPDTARISAGGPELVLNGAGERWILLMKIYAIGLYLPARRSTLPDVLAQRGPKRLLLVMQRELTGKRIHDYLIARITDGTQQDEMAAMKERMDDLDRIINAEHSIKRGGTIALDYLPEKGTVIRVNGVAKGAPIAGEDFYNALLKIWLGEHAKSPTLRDALLGHGAI